MYALEANAYLLLLNTVKIHISCHPIFLLCQCWLSSKFMSMTNLKYENWWLVQWWLGGIDWVTPINTNQSLTCKFSVHQDKKKMLTSQSYRLRTTKGLWQPTTDHSKDNRYLKGHICTNAISNYSLVKNLSSNVFNTYRKLQ